LISAAPRPGVIERFFREDIMSRRNGDRARFQKERKRKMLRREQLAKMMKAREAAKTPASNS
jgi:hypothetical protein